MNGRNVGRGFAILFGLFFVALGVATIIYKGPTVLALSMTLFGLAMVGFGWKLL